MVNNPKFIFLIYICLPEPVAGNNVIVNAVVELAIITLSVDNCVYVVVTIVLFVAIL